jgi:hypothetical protein
MTFEERMDAITMNLELMGHRLEDTRREAEERHRAWQLDAQASQREAEQRQREAEQRQREAEQRQREWEERQRVVALEMTDLREQGAVLLKATTQMLAVADAHDRRIARLERLSA